MYKRPRTPNRTQSRLYDLAPRKGYTIENTIPASVHRYRLRNDFTHQYEPSRTGSASWGIEAAVRFLKAQPDVD